MARTVDYEKLLPRDLSGRESYRLLIDLVAPRPIAWVSTVDGMGRANLAPFSYFQAVCARPPTVVLGLGWRADGTPKDTLANILETRQYTINHVSEPFIDAMNRTSGEYPPGHSEWEEAGVKPRCSAVVIPPWIDGVQAAFECRMTHAIPIGEGPAGGPASTLIVGEVVCVHVARALLRRDERGRLLAIDTAALAAVGRLGGIAYTKTTDVFELPRPRLSGAAGGDS